MPSTSNPYISVVILTGTQRKRVEKTLASVLSQEGADRAEVLIFDTVFGKYPPIQGSEHPSVRVIDSTNAVSYRVLRAEAASLARGEIVAYLEDHAEALPGWFNVMTRAFEAGHAGVGGTPQASNAGMGFSEITGLVNYKYQYSSEMPSAYVARTLPNHNSAYLRKVLLSFGDSLSTLIASDFLLGVKITEQGHTLLVDPEFRFWHMNLESTFMVHRNFFYWNIIFGRLRAQVFEWSIGRRILQVLATPLSPFVRYFKYFFHLYKYSPKKLPVFLRNSWVTLYTQGVAATGIAIGCLFDVKDAEMKFLRYELDLEHH